MPKAIEPAPGAFRRWLRSDMRILRWVFLGLYLAITDGLLFYAFAETSGEYVLRGILLGTVASQFLLIFGTGTIRLCYPIRKRRLVLPVVAAAFMLMLLVAGFLLAMSELLYLDDNIGFGESGFMLLLGLSWIGWGVLLFNHVRHRPRHGVLKRLATILFVGSLAELLATIPSHVIVSRRPGCLVGIATAIGVIAGLGVMLFSFGPMIALLFLRPRWRAELADTGTPYCPACGYDLRASPERCPECGLRCAGDEKD